MRRACIVAVTMTVLAITMLVLPIQIALALEPPLHRGEGVGGEVVVGNGTAASCTEATFLDALAVVQTGGGGTITFNCGTEPITITFTAYKPIPTAGITIDGGDKVTFSGNRTVAFFRVQTTGALTLANLTMTNGIYNTFYPLENNGILALEGVTVTKSASTKGAVRNTGNLIVQNTYFYSNVLNTPVGGAGGAVTNDAGRVSIEGSRFVLNAIVPTGTVSQGGAIINTDGTVMLTDTDFGSNFAQDGGAIYASGDSTVTIRGGYFETNIAGYGGVAEVYGGRMEVEGVTMARNYSGYGDGGALWIITGSLSVRNSTFVQNFAITTGGAISCYEGDLSVGFSTFTQNGAKTDGGAIYSACNGSIQQSTFDFNGADIFDPPLTTVRGGAIFQTGGVSTTMALDYNTITDNKATDGAGVYNDVTMGAALSMQRSIVVNNTGGNCGGTITSGGYNMTNNPTCPSFTLPGDNQNAVLPLAPLGNYGGSTQTRPSLTGSDAIDAIPTAQCNADFDQRLMPRPVGDGCDSGSVEGTPPPPPPAENKLYLPLTVTAAGEPQ